MIVAPTPDVLEGLGDMLRRGKLVAFPTETVYGLGANGLDESAVLDIFKAKGRPLNDPCILHVPDRASAGELLDLDGPEQAVFDALTSKLWPGPLSVIGKARPTVPRVVTAQTDFVAVRCPNHPVALKLLAAARVPLAAPSANRFGHVSPTCARHVVDDLGHWSGLRVVDGGSCAVGIESTVVKLDLANSRVVVLRKGGATLEQIRGALESAGGDASKVAVELQSSPQPGAAAAAAEAHDSETQQAPGMMIRHYAPSVPTYLLAGDMHADPLAPSVGSARKSVLIDFAAALRTESAHFGWVLELCGGGENAFADKPTPAGEEGSPSELACRSVFATLREAEELALAGGADAICLANFDPAAHGPFAAALHDRLFRAASGRLARLRHGPAGEVCVCVEGS